MQRHFAFDPGTAALGWAVIEAADGKIEIRACGVRLYSLTRQRIMETMKQRLKPQDRVKARQRRRMRLKQLRRLLQSIGLIEADESAHWKTGDGVKLKAWLAQSRDEALCKQSVVRIIFNVHRHRGCLEYGPDHESPRDFLERFLLRQSNWHLALADESVRTRVVAAVFFRHGAPQRGHAALPVSRLAELAASELMAVWRVLTAEFGPASLTVIEAALPPARKQPAKGVDDAIALQLLQSAKYEVNPRRLHKARLFVRQQIQDSDTAICVLTGEAFAFDKAMSAKVEIDHDIPKSRGGPGGRANLRLVLAQANRAKGAGSKGISPGPRNPVGVADADAIRQSLRLLRGRFQDLPCAPRLSFLSSRRVSMLRQGQAAPLDLKDRSDLRHHAEDAIFTGLASLMDDDGAIASTLQAAHWGDGIRRALRSARLSVRAERSEKGRIHDDTRYGIASLQSGFNPETHVAARKPVESLTRAMRSKIADPGLRCKAMSAGDTDITAIANIFGRARRVKVAQPASGHIRLTDEAGGFKAAVLAADNHHMDIVQMRDGSWRAFTVTRHERVQPGWRPEWETKKLGGKLVMRLHKGDMVEWLGIDGNREMLIVARLNGSSGIVHLIRPWATCGGLVAAAANTLRKREAKAVEAGPGGAARFRRTNAAWSVAPAIALVRSVEARTDRMTATDIDVLNASN